MTTTPDPAAAGTGESTLAQPPPPGAGRSHAWWRWSLAQGWHWARGIPWPRVAEMVLTVAAGWAASQKLARLSGTSLWVPAEWRVAIGVTVTALGTGVFGAIRARPEWKPPRPPADAPPDVAPPDVAAAEVAAGRAKVEAHKHREAVLAVWMLVGAVVALALFMVLKTVCVVPFDPRDWLDHQRVADARAAADAQTAVLPTPGRPRAEPAPAATPPNPTATSDDRPFVPEFVDLDRRQVYLPLWYPADLSAYLHRLSASTGDDGLHYMLAHEPDHLFDVLSTRATAQVAVTNCLFLILDALFVCLSTAAAAYTFDALSAIGGGVLTKL